MTQECLNPEPKHKYLIVIPKLENEEAETLMIQDMQTFLESDQHSCVINIPIKLYKVIDGDAVYEIINELDFVGFLKRGSDDDS